MSANVRIGNRLGINHASNHERGTTNRVAIVGAPIEKIDNGFFRSPTDTLDAAVEFDRVRLQLSSRCVIRLPHFWISRIRKIDRVALAQVRRASGAADENRNSPARFHAESERCASCYHFRQLSPPDANGENEALMRFAVTISETRT